jgi:Uma2 family endonuclease
MSVAIAKWTLDDYHRMIESGLLNDRSVELFNGEIVEICPEGESHAYLSLEAAKYLGHVLGELADIRQGKPITLPHSHSEPEPDIANSFNCTFLSNLLYSCLLLQRDFNMLSYCPSP